MAAPSVSGGVTVLEPCDTGSSGVAPSAVLASSTPTTSTAFQTTYEGGINSTGSGAIYSNGASTGLQAGIYALSGSTDFTVANRLAFIHSHVGGNSLDNLTASTGAMLYINSGSLGTEEAAFPLYGNSAKPPANYSACVVNLNRSTDAHIYSGSFDPSDVTHMGLAASYSTGAAYESVYTDSIGYVDPYLIINGTSGDKGTFALIPTDIDTSDTKVNESPTDNLHHCMFGWGVGNGSTLTEFSDTLKVFEFAKTFDIAGLWGRAHLNDNDIGFETNASSSDVISFELCNWISDTPFYFNSIGSTSATVSYTACVIQSAGELTIVNSHAFSGCTFDSCAKIDAQNPTFTNTAIKNSATTALELTDTGGGNLTGVTFSGNQTAIIVDTAGNAAITVTGCTFDSDNTYFIEYTGTGTLTVTAAVSIAAGKLNESGGGTITVVAPTVDLTVDVDQSGCQIHVYTTNTQTTLDTEASAAQLVYTHGDETVDITVLKDGYVPYRQTVLTLSGDVTVDVQLSESREYDSSHGLTYTTSASAYDDYNVITGITAANPAVVTYSGADNFSNTDIISIQDVLGMTEVNGKRYTVANLNTGANTFELSGINSSAYTAYTSAGVVLSGLSVPTFGPSGRGVFSLLMEQFRTNSSLYNLPFNFEMDGDGALYLLNGVEGVADVDIERMTAAGVGYLDVDSTTTATWIGMESVGTIPGTNTGEWTADDAVTVTDARASGVFDEIIQVYGDADHSNFDNRANRIILKMNINGYREERINIRELYGVSGNFKPTHYVVPIAPVAIGAATGDPALTTDPVITDHAATPQAWNGKNFLITITDGTTPNTGEGILRHLNYFLRSATDTTLDGNDPFSWPEMMSEVVAGTSYETIYGYTEDAQTSTLKGVRVVKNDGTTAHPDFTRFQSNDGTYYTVPITSNITITGMPTAGGSIRLQIHNETAKTASAWGATTAYSLGDKVLRSTGLGSESTAGLYMVCTTAGTSGGSEPTWDTTPGNTTVDSTVTWTTYAILFHDADPSSASLADTYVDGEEFASGDTYRIRFAELNTTTSFKTYETTGLVGATGFTVVIVVVADSVYAANAVDGSSAAVTAKFTADYANDEIDLDANQDFAVTEAFAYFCYETTTTSGMYEFWGGVTAIDSANYRNNTAAVSIYFDETAGFVKQTDSARWYRDDDTRPVLDPTTGAAGLEINWRNPVYQLETGVSGLTGSESTELFKNSTIITNLAIVDTNVDQIETAVITNAAGTDIAADIIAMKAETVLIVADTNELQTDWANAGRLDAILDSRMAEASIDTTAGAVDLVTTTTTNTDMRGTDSANTTAPDNASITAIKAKTDDLTFTVANKVDTNVKSVNDVTVTGTGATGDEWGP